MDKKQTIRILLINPDNEILLMRAIDPTTTSMDRAPRAAFWCTIGGKIEAGETVEQAAHRELFEETGLREADIKFGPIVWYGKHEMIISGKHVELDEQFIVAYTNKEVQISSENFTDNEKSVVTHQAWLSLDSIVNHHEAIFPAILKTHLAPILAKNYPLEPQWVNLSLQP